ncbi:ovostatin-like [Spea bombifrons]|uniref:ovostatin-like n=1 Tax=Spea bombifrons TaxID=233779 RepID=UPI00234964A6|nr:ovostatin-like [Spea bombifrons]
MSLWRLLLSASLLCLIPGGISEPQYVLSIPAMLKSGEKANVCMNLKDYDPSLQLRIVLEYDGVNTTIFTEDAAASPFFRCNEFLVPVVEKAVPVFVTLSASGGDVLVHQRKTVVINTMENVHLVQMDKPIYRPGQKVLFRLISLNSQLQPVEEKYPAVYLTDPSNSRVSQWLNLESERGVVQLHFQLISDAAPGSYYITAERESGGSVGQYFTVDQYVLPRFDVSMVSPNTLSILDDILEFNGSAIYTHGQPVPGSVTGRCCRSPDYFYRRSQNCVRNKGISCSNFTGELDADGTFRGVIDLTPFNVGLLGSNTNLNLDVTVTEDGTGIQVTESRYIRVTSQLANVDFDYESMNRYYRRGIPYRVSVSLSDESGRPLPGENIHLEVDGRPVQRVTTDADGRADYTIDTISFVEENFTVRASYQNEEQCYYREWDRYGPDYPTAEYMVNRFYSQTGSFLQVQGPRGELSCGQSHPIEVQYIVTPEGVGEGATVATVYFLVMSRTQIVLSGQQDVDLTSSLNGTFTVDLPVSADFAPGADLVVYIILETELIADTVRLNVEKCFKNQVSLSFSEEQGPPASDVDLQLSAAPGSLCGVRVIDYSLILLQPYEEFTAENVYYSLRYGSLYGYFIGGFNVEEPSPPCEDPNKQVFCGGRYYLPVSSRSEGDTYTNLKNIGLILGTGARLRKPEVCDKNPEVPEAVPFRTSKKVPAGAEALSAEAGAGSTETLRKNFTDTWVWQLVSTDDSGRGALTQTVPDSITQWQGNMFCVSETEGFGMTRYPANFTSFLPFFVELSMPYSITRGETLVLVASVSNYMESCAKVRVTLEGSDDFAAVPQEGEQDACICPGERTSFSWNVDAVSLGEMPIQVSAETSHIGKTCDGPGDRSQEHRKDTVIQTILVEAEGIRKEVTFSQLICVRNRNAMIPLSLPPPENVVPDSAEAFVTVLGDILGLPFQNLQNLVQMPYGCGEQNLARMAPIPYVLEYLNITNQLTPELLQKATGYLTEGYLRQLRYRLSNGGFGVFGGWQDQGNSWLTAYVFKTFEKSKKYIFIDENIQQQSLVWLEGSQRLESGCFSPQGRLFSEQDGARDDLTFTAFLAIALLESNYSPGRTLLAGALSCLEAASITNQTTYNQALMVYAFTLAGNWEQRCRLLKVLKSKAVSEGGTVHWEREQEPEREWVPYFSRPFSSAGVEITSYILVSIAKGPNVTQAELNYMAQISVWLIRQQNSYGGFCSTKDTVVALQALCKYAQLIFMPNAKHNVSVRNGNGEIAKFTLNQDNRLLVQRQPLPDIPGEYTIGVSGLGCCLVQSTVRYNIPVSEGNSAFSVSANTSSEGCLNGVAYTFTVGISVSYNGRRRESGMAIVDVKLVSGYQADYLSLIQMEESKLISRAEERNGHVYLYLDSVSSESVYLSFKVQMGNRVLNVKTGSIYVYDYYEAAENGYAQYSHPCAASE